MHYLSVGSSMGGWISFHIAQENRKRIAGIVTISPALDFISNVFRNLPTQVRQRIEAGESYDISPERNPKKVLTKELITDSLSFNLLHLPTIAVHCPVRILHGMQDDAVAWSQSMGLVSRLESVDVEFHLLKKGDHRLSKEDDLILLESTVDVLLKTMNSNENLADQGEYL